MFAPHYVIITGLCTYIKMENSKLNYARNLLDVKMEDIDILKQLTEMF